MKFFKPADLLNSSLFQKIQLPLLPRSHGHRSFTLISSLLIILTTFHLGFSQPKNQPEIQPSYSIGSYNNGCIENAMALPAQGMGYQVLHFLHQRIYGHPILIKYIENLGKQVSMLWNPKSKKKVRKKKPIPLQNVPAWVLGVDDLALQFGGPIPGPHHSHQTGLDVDISFSPVDLKTFSTDSTDESRALVYMVDLKNGQISAHFGQKQILLLKQAVHSPWVDRIFVNPAIKQFLCQLKKATDPEETWIRKIRPWYGHAAHFHVRLHCPQSSLATCRSQPTLPKGDGCGKELARWFIPKIPSKVEIPKVTPPPPVPPLACQELWAKHQVPAKPALEVHTSPIASTIPAKTIPSEEIKEILPLEKGPAALENRGAPNQQKINPLENEEVTE